MDDRFRAPVPKHRIARDLRIRPVREAIGVQRSDQRHLMPCAPCRMSAHKIKGIGAGLPQPRGCDRDDQSQQLVAVCLGLLGEFVVDRVPILGALALQQLERMVPDFVGSLGAIRCLA